MVKLSPAATDIRAIAKAIEKAGADSISATNTLSAWPSTCTAQAAAGQHVRRSVRSRAQAGALRVVYEVAQVVDIPIVAIGGIGSLDDALEFFYAGASAVQVWTAVFADRSCHPHHRRVRSLAGTARLRTPREGRGCSPSAAT
jgi:dihydroorotate dehydrogenase